MLGLVADNARQYDWYEPARRFEFFQYESSRYTPISSGDRRLAGWELESVGPYFSSHHFFNDLDVRRYSLLRLGLAAYRIEHGEYPQQLSSLEKYYRGGLPTTAKSNQSVDWFPDGLMMEFTEVVDWTGKVAIEKVSLEQTGPALIFSDRSLEKFDHDQNRYVPARDDPELKRLLKGVSHEFVMPFRNQNHHGNSRFVDARLPALPEAKDAN